MTISSEHVRRVLARDDLLHLAADADTAVGIVRQRESLARRVVDEPSLYALALRHYLAETRARDWAIRAQAWSYAGTVVSFCSRVGIPLDAGYSASELYARAAEELAGHSPPDAALPRDLALGVFDTYRRSRHLRLTGRYAEAVDLVAVPRSELFGTGAEPHWAHYLFEYGACLISNGQAAQVTAALGEQRRYWEETRAAEFSTRHRFDFVLSLADWDLGRPAAAAPHLRSAWAQLQQVGAGVLRTALHEDRIVQNLSVSLSLAELLATGSPTDDRVREAVRLGGRALKTAERIRSRWRVIARSRAPLAVAIRRVYGDIALLADGLPGPEASRLGLRVSLSAKQTGFASRIREGRLLMSEHVGGLLDQILALEDPPVKSLVAGDEAARTKKLSQLRFRLEEEVSPMLADTVLPTPAKIRRLVRVVGRRYALDFVSLPDTLSGDRTNWFRSTFLPRRAISFERFLPGTAYASFFEGSADAPPWLGRLGEAIDAPGPDWAALATELLPAALIDALRARTRENPLELVISAHSTLSLVPWPGLHIDDAGTTLVERAVLAQCPTLTCLSRQPLPTVTGPALVRLVSRAEHGVDVYQERAAWDLDEDNGTVPLSRCTVGPDSAPVRVDIDLPAALRQAEVGWQFVHVAAHGDGEGLAQHLLLPQKLLAAQALALRWPPSVLMASCHVGRLVNPEDAEPLSFVMALLTGGSRCVVAGIDAVSDVWTGRAAARIVDAIRLAPTRLDQALREVQLTAVHHPDPRWALLNAYVR